MSKFIFDQNTGFKNKGLLDAPLVHRLVLLLLEIDWEREEIRGETQIIFGEVFM